MPESSCGTRWPGTQQCSGHGYCVVSNASAVLGQAGCVCDHGWSGYGDFHSFVNSNSSIQTKCDIHINTVHTLWNVVLVFSVVGFIQSILQLLFSDLRDKKFRWKKLTLYCRATNRITRVIACLLFLILSLYRTSYVNQFGHYPAIGQDIGALLLQVLCNFWFTSIPVHMAFMVQKQVSDVKKGKSHRHNGGVFLSQENFRQFCLIAAISVTTQLVLVATHFFPYHEHLAGKMFMIVQSILMLVTSEFLLIRMCYQPMMHQLREMLLRLPPATKELSGKLGSVAPSPNANATSIAGTGTSYRSKSPTSFKVSKKQRAQIQVLLQDITRTKLKLRQSVFANLIVNSAFAFIPMLFGWISYNLPVVIISATLEIVNANTDEYKIKKHMTQLSDTSETTMHSKVTQSILGSESEVSHGLSDAFSEA